MRKTHLIPLLLLVAVVGACQPEPEAANAIPTAELAQEPQEEPQPALTYVVGEGRSLEIFDRTLEAGEIGFVEDRLCPQPPPEVLEEAREQDQTDIHRCWYLVDGMWVGVASGRRPPIPEGRLMRFHCVAPDMTDSGPIIDPPGRPLVACLGFYSNIAEDMAIEARETYDCVFCGHRLVCGVNPRC